MVECQLPKLKVASSILVARSTEVEKFFKYWATRLINTSSQIARWNWRAVLKEIERGLMNWQCRDSILHLIRLDETAGQFRCRLKKKATRLCIISSQSDRKNWSGRKGEDRNLNSHESWSGIYPSKEKFLNWKQILYATWHIWVGCREYLLALRELK